eukprot:Phypoly_transcript_10526.p2 GENE.Phypoly_transcript_10526~~Phypoly_transcript_10526.p2  ORF type:complete len:142 (+),score=25.26 Phypoly_transcript_10526:268-693(+)
MDGAQISNDRLVEYKAAFTRADKDNDGHLNASDLQALFQELKRDTTADEIKVILQNFGSKTIDFDEFVEYISKSSSTEILRKTFQEFDLDKNGFLSRDEVKTAMSKLGEGVTDAEIDQFIKDTDTNGDGLISFEEFCTLMG